MLDDENYRAYTMSCAAEIIGCTPDVLRVVETADRETKRLVTTPSR